MRKQEPRRGYATLIAGVLAVTAVSVGAQTASTSHPAEIASRYLQQDIFVRPGIGFQRVRLGNSFVEVARTWGTPLKETRSALFGLTKTWVYNGGQDTQVVVSGGSKVDAIEVVGGVTSPYQSSEGARFGMSPHQLITIYGAPREADELSRLSYPRRGIEFAFANGALRSIKVFPPKR